MGQRPLYVDSLVNISERAAISKIRTSAHLLMIERGRHKNIPTSERFCTVCKSGKIENEEHFRPYTLMHNIHNVFHIRLSLFLKQLDMNEEDILRITDELLLRRSFILETVLS
jgi:hypothetical protein